jgi:hypothetical protein
MAPPPLPNLDRAREVLKDFSIFWREETDQDAKRQFLGLIFNDVWQDERRVVAVQPKAAFLAYFEAQTALGTHPGNAGVGTKRERRDSNPRPLP